MPPRSRPICQVAPPASTGTCGHSAHAARPNTEPAHVSFTGMIMCSASMKAMAISSAASAHNKPTTPTASGAKHSHTAVNTSAVSSSTAK